MSEPTLEDRVSRLEDALARIEQELTNIGLHFETLSTAHAVLRKRFNSYYPERHHCPHCKAVVHAASTACRACGRSWGPTPDPKAGLPR